MKKLYADTDVVTMEYYLTVLESHGIKAYIRHEHTGLLPMSDFWPELWVINDDDFDKAEELLENMEEKKIDEKSKGKH